MLMKDKPIITDISLGERRLIYNYLKQGRTLKNISDLIGRNPGSLSLEMRRGGVQKGGDRTVYDPEKAHETYLECKKRQFSAHKRILTEEEKEKLRDLLIDKKMSVGEVHRKLCLHPRIIKNWCHENKICIRVKSVEGVHDKIDALSAAVGALKDIVMDMAKKIR